MWVQIVVIEELKRKDNWEMKVLEGFCFCWNQGTRRIIIQCRNIYEEMLFLLSIK